MPVECFIQTGERTVISYLFKPLRDQLMRTFRERVVDLDAEDRAGVLADCGTTIRMTFDGKDCAKADPKAALPQPTAAAPARNSRLFMALLFVCWPPVRDVLNQVRRRASRLERKLPQQLITG